MADSNPNGPPPQSTCLRTEERGPTCWASARTCTFNARADAYPGELGHPDRANGSAFCSDRVGRGAEDGRPLFGAIVRDF